MKRMISLAFICFLPIVLLAKEVALRIENDSLNIPFQSNQNSRVHALTVDTVENNKNFDIYSLDRVLHYDNNNQNELILHKGLHRISIRQGKMLGVVLHGEDNIFSQWKSSCNYNTDVKENLWFVDKIYKDSIKLGGYTYNLSYRNDTIYRKDLSKKVGYAYYVISSKGNKKYDRLICQIPVLDVTGIIYETVPYDSIESLTCAHSHKYDCNVHDQINRNNVNMDDYENYSYSNNCSGRSNHSNYHLKGHKLHSRGITSLHSGGRPSFNSGRRTSFHSSGRPSFHSGGGASFHAGGSALHAGSGALHAVGDVGKVFKNCNLNSKVIIPILVVGAVVVSLSAVIVTTAVIIHEVKLSEHEVHSYVLKDWKRSVKPYKNKNTITVAT